MNVHTYFKCTAHLYKANGYCIKNTIFADSEEEMDQKKVDMIKQEAGAQAVKFSQVREVKETYFGQEEFFLVVPAEQITHEGAKKVFTDKVKTAETRFINLFREEV